MDDIRLKRLTYRSWHRGCKETDLILGRFADTRLPVLTPELLDDFERLLDESDADIWDWLTGKTAPKEEYKPILALLTADENT